MVNYQNGKVYKIINLKDENKVYIGSTVKPLCQRMTHHRDLWKHGKEFPLYKGFTEDGIENFKIILIELHPCNIKEELTAKEQYWIDDFKKRGFLLYNGRKALGIDKERIKQYKIDNSKTIREYQKEYKKCYRQINQEKIKEKKREYRVKNIERIREYDRVRSKRYYREHYDEIRMKAKQYKLRKRNEKIFRNECARLSNIEF